LAAAQRELRIAVGFSRKYFWNLANAQRVGATGDLEANHCLRVFEWSRPFGRKELAVSALHYLRCILLGRLRRAKKSGC
jgi:hypothetical protein